MLIDFIRNQRQSIAARYKLIDGLQKKFKDAKVTVEHLQWCLRLAREYLKNYFETVPDEDVTFEHLIEATEKAEEIVASCLAR